MAAGGHDLPEDEAAAAVVHVNPEKLVSGEVDAALEHLLGHVHGVEFDQKLDNALWGRMLGSALCVGKRPCNKENYLTGPLEYTATKVT